MDIVQDWAEYLLSNHAGYLPYARQALSIGLTVKNYLLALIDQVSQKPDLATIALLLVIVLISLKVLDMLYQTLVFWLRLARRVVFYGGLIGLALWMYTRGPDGVAADLQYWYNTWNGEYEYWKGQEQAARVLRQKPAYGRGGGYTKRQQAWY